MLALSVAQVRNQLGVRECLYIPYCPFVAAFVGCVMLVD
jgi:hypothetical protein